MSVWADREAGRRDEDPAEEYMDRNDLPPGHRIAGRNEPGWIWTASDGRKLWITDEL